MLGKFTIRRELAVLKYGEPCSEQRGDLVVRVVLGWQNPARVPGEWNGYSARGRVHEVRHSSSLRSGKAIHY
jgi:hypothetical protein